MIAIHDSPDFRRKLTKNNDAVFLGGLPYRACITGGNIFQKIYLTFNAYFQANWMMFNFGKLLKIGL